MRCVQIRNNQLILCPRTERFEVLGCLILTIQGSVSLIQMSIGNHRYGNTLMGDSERVVGLDNYETLDIYNSLFATTTTTTTTVSNITTTAAGLDLGKMGGKN